METNEINKLKFRRQYLIAPSEIEIPFLHNKHYLNGEYQLNTHIDLIVNEANSNNSKIILLGDLFDYEHPEKNNLDILNNLIMHDFNSILEIISNYSGRFVLIFIENLNIKIFHDCTATQKVYYCHMGNKTWISSRPNLIAQLLNLDITTDSSKIEFYNSPNFSRLNNSNIGNTTIYDDVFQLIPNHYLDIASGETFRYWPNKRIDYLPLSDVAEKCAKIIKGYLKSIVNRYPVMIPVTAGKDSRLLVSATKDFSDKVYYYINKESGLNYDSKDIAVPKKMFKKLGIEYHILEPETTIDEDFIKQYHENNGTASVRYLPFIYNYYKNFAEKVNLPGNFASGGFEHFKELPKSINGESLAKLYKIKPYGFVTTYYSKWLTESQDLCERYNIDLLQLFYWEERLSNWGTQIQMEKDIAQEEFNPLNSRLLVVLFLSVNPKYIRPPYYILHRKIIKLLWPDLLQVPINPSFRNTVKKILASFGLLNFLTIIRRH